MLIKNPVIPGFHPDPCILRVGDDYYIATSTFEWFPGVMIYHSKDLSHWTLVAQPLDEKILDLRGVPASGGIWAPCLSWHQGTFYLVYTVVRSYTGMYKDCHNFLVTADNIRGPWQKPVRLHSLGFDPSLFHDDDGRKWLVSMQNGFGFQRNEFNGIILQEYSETLKTLTGKPEVIFKGTSLGITEGPHIYKKDGYYYLVTAEGGTEFDHAVTVARSRKIRGVYEVCPHHPLMTSGGHPEVPLQKAGHGSFVEMPDGRWLMAHLASRPVGAQQMCILGRETCLQEIVWTDGWPALAGGGRLPADAINLEENSVREKREAVSVFREDFDGKIWQMALQSLRCLLGKRASLTARPGWLRLYGGESLESGFEQSLLAHRQQHFYCQVTVKMIFHPESYQQMAGLVYYYDSLSYYYLFVTADEDGGYVLQMDASVMGRHTFPLGRGIRTGEQGTICLQLKTSCETAQFFYSLDGTCYRQAGPVLEASVLSDDYYYKFDQYRFTGAFIGICCQDLAAGFDDGGYQENGCYADFDYYDYRECENADKGQHNC